MTTKLGPRAGPGWKHHQEAAHPHLRRQAWGPPCLPSRRPRIVVSNWWEQRMCCVRATGGPTFVLFMQTHSSMGGELGDRRSLHGGWS